MQPHPWDAYSTGLFPQEEPDPHLEQQGVGAAALPFLQCRRHVAESSQCQVEGGVWVALSCCLPETGEEARSRKYRRKATSEHFLNKAVLPHTACCLTVEIFFSHWLKSSKRSGGRCDPKPDVQRAGHLHAACTSQGMTQCPQKVLPVLSLCLSNLFQQKATCHLRSYISVAHLNQCMASFSFFSTPAPEIKAKQ